MWKEIEQNYRNHSDKKRLDSDDNSDSRSAIRNRIKASLLPARERNTWLGARWCHSYVTVGHVLNYVS